MYLTHLNILNWIKSVAYNSQGSHTEKKYNFFRPVRYMMYSCVYKKANFQQWQCNVYDVLTCLWQGISFSRSSRNWDHIPSSKLPTVTVQCVWYTHVFMARNFFLQEFQKLGSYSLQQTSNSTSAMCMMYSRVYGKEFLSPGVPEIGRILPTPPRLYFASNSTRAIHVF